MWAEFNFDLQRNYKDIVDKVDCIYDIDAKLLKLIANSPWVNTRSKKLIQE